MRRLDHASSGESGVDYLMCSFGVTLGFAGAEGSRPRADMIKLSLLLDD